MVRYAQVILFMDLISLPATASSVSLSSLSPASAARLAALLLALAAASLSLAKLRRLGRRKVVTSPGLAILVWYFLFQAVWVLGIFAEGNLGVRYIYPFSNIFLDNLDILNKTKANIIKSSLLSETRLLRDLSAEFPRSYVSHFLKNVMKVFLATIYTLFTHYLHTIYTLSTHYLPTIYTLSTQYLQYLLQAGPGRVPVRHAVPRQLAVQRAAAARRHGHRVRGPHSAAGADK